MRAPPGFPGNERVGPLRGKITRDVHLPMANAGILRKRTQETPALVVADNADCFHRHAGIEALDAKGKITARTAAMALFRNELRDGRLHPANASPRGCCQRTMCRP